LTERTRILPAPAFSGAKKPLAADHRNPMRSTVSNDHRRSLHMGITIFFVFLAIVLIAIIHFMTTSRSMDQIGLLPSKEYWAFLTRKGTKVELRTEIPAPPDGVRDEEVESLLLAGKIKQAREILQERLEEARVAPLGKDAKIKRVAHYTALLPKD
jgi:hypothetical protein